MHTSPLGPATCHTPPPPNNGSMHTRVRVQVPPPHATLQLENGDTLRPPGRVPRHTRPPCTHCPRHTCTHRSTTCRAAHRSHPGRVMGLRDGRRVLPQHSRGRVVHQPPTCTATRHTQLSRVTPNAQSVFRLSVRGLGSVVVAVTNPGKYCSVSAFAPISIPTQVCASCDCACVFTPPHSARDTPHCAPHTP